MTTSRTWRREARVLVTVSELCGDQRGARLRDVIAIDFLLQHPAILGTFIALDVEVWPAGSYPTAAESDSSEESFLRWKRAAGLSLMTPIVARHIARGLMTRTRPDVLAMTPLGQSTARLLVSTAEANEHERLSLATATFVRDRDRALDQVSRALAQRAA